MRADLATPNWTTEVDQKGAEEGSKGRFEKRERGMRNGVTCARVFSKEGHSLKDRKKRVEQTKTRQEVRFNLLATKLERLSP